jgi:hypothetical protein
VQAGILDPPGSSPDLARQILADSHLSEEQKQALVRIYLSFRREHDGDGAGPVPDATTDAPGTGAPAAGAGGPAAAPVPGDVPAAPGSGRPGGETGRHR